MDGWTGRLVRGFELGDTSDHPLGKPVTDTDNGWFARLTQNAAKVPFDAHCASGTGFVRPLLNSPSALVAGQSVVDPLSTLRRNASGTIPVSLRQASPPTQSTRDPRTSRSSGDGGILTAAEEEMNDRSVVGCGCRTVEESEENQ
ncbi:hypothetical protein RW1_022_00880 [Rhodococcus wratislaviensis NBRC 100605]|uniref:Uncharacterized protein n=1 Tax=Rhodococcus wratislaviensis NBRC 100605 TaxID=1219028 RepID=X0PRK8_RHOWR|nr:hypothetical protein RW1_022_00880 [Rhodococcus wratislaviensis NBRC 100605]